MNFKEIDRAITRTHKHVYRMDHVNQRKTNERRLPSWLPHVWVK